MTDKKRKETSARIEHPSKKSKRSVAVTSDESLKPSLKGTVEAAAPIKTRKRAVDFLSEGEDESTQVRSNGTASDKKKVKFADVVGEQSAKKNKKKDGGSTSKSKSGSKPKSQISSTKDANGAVDERDVTTSRPAKSKSLATTSLQAEAQRTVDKEIEDEFGPPSDDDATEKNPDHQIGADDENIDQASNLLVGLDSDTEDPAQDQGLDVTRLGAVPNYKKTQKKLLKAKKDGSEGTGVVYVGRIPHGFYEQQMREYFSQFGEITRLRLSRNKRTAASKHFAFIEFKANEVAKIVAETMDNYLMFGHILKCKYVPEDSLHPEVWKGANKKYRRIPYEKLERESLAAPKSQSYWQRKVEKEKEKREKLAAKLKELDYEMPQSKLTDPAVVVNQRKLQPRKDEEPKQIEKIAAEPNPANENSEMVPKDSDEAIRPSKEKLVKNGKASGVPSHEEKLAGSGESTAELTKGAQPPITSTADIAVDENTVKDKPEKKKAASKKTVGAQNEHNKPDDSTGIEPENPSEIPAKSKGRKPKKK